MERPCLFGIVTKTGLKRIRLASHVRDYV
jgi:hypothetical protein